MNPRREIFLCRQDMMRIVLNTHASNYYIGDVSSHFKMEWAASLSPKNTWRHKSLPAGSCVSSSERFSANSWLAPRTERIQFVVVRLFFIIVSRHPLCHLQERTIERIDHG